MSDQLDALFAGVRGVQPPAAFAPAEQVRWRGRQRTHRKALLAGAGVLTITTAAAGLGAGLALPRPDGVAPPTDSTPTTTRPTSPPATASPAPSRTSSPPPTRKAGSVLLQPDDLGPGTWRPFEAEQMQNRDRWYWGLWDGNCPAYKSSLFPSLPHRHAVETVAYQAVGGSLRSVSQVVERYDNGWGGRNLNDVRAVIDRCGNLDPTPETLAMPNFAIVDTGFAGDDSLLVRVDLVQLGQGPSSDPQPYIAVVRVGDLVTTVRAYPPDADRVRGIAQRAAARLG
ncbi:hypothetical protein GA0070624_4119 [Micromonospora rhizosphaerae]|uniref:PknH-like extracellular domain-containing protein n=1 Tax=Micromonospora rhizosphaerae TaxID=568872 RepID=A0A1C6SMG8_9ACTN|nr:hypothetical protein [Micromonospora rhizosphaerae]SCL30658.1 hypothetical protein GA0070624_4119 [Micromonospora rhizosphaerae]